jgi:nucleoside-diphosphate-sugar epimerase
LADSLKDRDEAVLLAALVGEPLCDKRPDETMEVNFRAAEDFAKACANLGVRRFVFASTDSCYGARENERLTELSKLAPLSLYAKAKAMAEEAILSLGGPPDFQPTILRMATLYGPSARPRFDLAVNVLARDATLKGQIRIFSGEQWRPLCHVADAALAYLLALDAPKELVSGRIFNVGSNGQNVQFKDLGALIAEAIPGTKVETVSMPPDLRDYWVSFDKIARDLNFKPQKTLRQGILEIRELLLAGSPNDPYAARHQNAGA